MRKPKTLKERAGAYSRRLCGEAAGELNDARRACALSGYLAGHRANRISAAERRVVEAAVKWAKSGDGLDSIKPELALLNAIEDLNKLERAKGDRK